MINLATQNGISKGTYHSRIKRGWSKSDAATRPVLKGPGRKGYQGEYAVYKNDEIVAIGTAKECADELGVSAEYIYWMTMPVGKRRLADRKNPDKATTAVKLDVD